MRWYTNLGNARFAKLRWVWSWQRLVLTLIEIKHRTENTESKDKRDFWGAFIVVDLFYISFYENVSAEN